MGWIKSALGRGQGQAAGAQSQQLQAGRDIVVGVTAADVVEITRATIRQTVQDELTPVAEAIANDRVARLATRIEERFEPRPELWSAFADPDFQYSLRDAGRAAASNDDEHTEELLVDLLAHRAEQGSEYRVRLATSQAIRAADKLSLEALKGLTGLWALGHLGPTIPGAIVTIAGAKNVAERLTTLGPPSGQWWIEDLEALSLARGSQSGLTVTRKPYRQMLRERAAADLNPGIDPEGARDLIDRVAASCAQIRAHIVEHPLRPGRVVLTGASTEEFLGQLPQDCERTPDLEALMGQNGFGAQDPAAVEEFDRRINESEPLVSVADWWDKLPWVDLTLVGRVIGFVNAKRHIPFGGAQTIAELLALPVS